MIIIKYSRRSVCMGDDINAGNYTLKFKDDATLKDLLDIITSILIIILLLTKRNVKI